MEQELERLITSKQDLRDRLSKLRNNLLARVFGDIIESKKLRVIHKNITTLAKQSKLPDKYVKAVANFVTKVATKVKKKTDGESFLDIGVGVLSLFTKEKVFERTKSLTNKITIDYEAEQKDKIIKDELNQNRKLENPRIFYLCSEHNDSASDHEKWQGKLYYDNQWRNYLKDPVRIKQVHDFIIKNKLKSFQWVTDAPVYMITRPNCRHYFRALTIDEVIGKGLNTLLTNYKMHHKEGKRLAQTKAYDLKKNYKLITVQRIIKEYQDRLMYHKAFYQAKKLLDLKKAIEKDEFLIKKWQKYLTKVKNGGTLK